MEEQARHHFEQILTLAYAQLEHVVIKSQDISEQRALLQFEGMWQSHRIVVTEILRRTGRAYAYYVLRDNRVVWAWDNAPDREALRLEFGKEFAKHIHQEIPHAHARDGSIRLTPSKTFSEFIAALVEAGE